MCPVYSTYNSVYKLKIKTNIILMQVTEYISQNRCTFLQLQWFIPYNNIDIAFEKKEFAYAFVLQIGLSNCIFFVLLRLRGHTLLSSGGSGNLKLPFITCMVKV